MRAASGDDVTLRMDQEGLLTILAGPSLLQDPRPRRRRVPHPADGRRAESIDLPFRTYRNLIAKIFFAISSEESRFQLSGALMRFGKDSLTLVATDGHRLALVGDQGRRARGLRRGDRAAQGAPGAAALRRRGPRLPPLRAPPLLPHRPPPADLPHPRRHLSRLRAGGGQEQRQGGGGRPPLAGRGGAARRPCSPASGRGRSASSSTRTA